MKTFREDPGKSGLYKNLTIEIPRALVREGLTEHFRHVWFYVDILEVLVRVGVV
jgi:hypothetical protein